MKQYHGSWGNRLVTYEDQYKLVTILFLDPLQRCSWHYHDHSFNQFVCITGKVGIKTANGYTTILEPKQIFIVPPGIKHEFQTYEDGAIVEEISFVQYNPHDINREVVGGPLSDVSICGLCNRPVGRNDVGEWDCSCSRQF